MLDELRQLTLLTAGLKRCAEGEELLESAFRKTPAARRNLYRRIAQKTMLLLARQPTCTLHDCVSTLKLILATHSELHEQELLERLVSVLCHLLHDNWDRLVKAGRPHLKFVPEEGTEADDLSTHDQEIQYSWRLSKQLLQECA